MTSLNLSANDVPDLSQKTAIVTGGASGIGLATATLFADKGASVHILDRNLPDGKLPPRITFTQCDVTKWAELRQAFDRIGKVDIAVANAGVSEETDYFKDTFDDAGRLLEPEYQVLDVNYRAVLSFIKLSLSKMRKAGGGSIVITSSATAYSPEQSLPVYSSSKLALIGLVRGLRSTLHLDDISINSVAPTATITKLLPRNLATPLMAAGLPVSSADFVGLAIAYSATAAQSRTVETYGKDFSEHRHGRWNGRCILTLGETYTELEEPIAELRPQWFGAENTKLTRMQQAATDFRNLDFGIQKANGAV